MRMSATSYVSKIMLNPIGDVAATMKAAIDGVTDEYIRSYIDYLEVKGTQSKKISPAESDLRIQSMLGMGICDVDFRWGAPQLHTWEQYIENRVIFIVNDPGKDGCLKVVPALDSSIMQQFKKVFHEELLENLS
ncbi:hydroxycinnamoyltransferase 4-like [Carex rostrata]